MEFGSWQAAGRIEGITYLPQCVQWPGQLVPSEPVDGNTLATALDMRKIVRRTRGGSFTHIKLSHHLKHTSLTRKEKP